MTSKIIKHAWTIGLYAAGSAFLCATPLHAYGENREVLAQHQQISSNWRTMNLELLRQPGNAAVLQAIKDKAKEHSTGDDRAILIRMNDQETIAYCLADLHSADPANPQRAVLAATQFRKAANPRVFPLLAADLGRQESPDRVSPPGIGVPPPSVLAALVIRNILEKSPEFSVEVRAWAAGLPQFGEDLRGPVRAWWQLNKAAVEAGNYQAAVVPAAH